MAQKKVYFSLSESMLTKLDKIAETYGVTRSAYLAMMVGQNVTAIEKTIEQMPEIMKSISSNNSEN